MHDVFAVTLGLWARWTVPRLGHMSWLVDIKAELVPPTTMKSRAAAEEHAWWNKHVNRNVQKHSGLCPWALRHGLLRKSGKRGSLLMQNVGGEYYSLCPFRGHRADREYGFVASHRDGVEHNADSQDELGMDKGHAASE